MPLLNISNSVTIIVEMPIKKVKTEINIFLNSNLNILLIMAYKKIIRMLPKILMFCKATCIANATLRPNKA